MAAALSHTWEFKSLQLTTSLQCGSNGPRQASVLVTRCRLIVVTRSRIRPGSPIRMAISGKYLSSWKTTFLKESAGVLPTAAVRRQRVLLISQRAEDYF